MNQTSEGDKIPKTRRASPGALARPAVALLALSLLAAISRYRYLLFHTLAELFCVVVSATIFAIIWNSRRVSRDNFFTVIGIASLFIAVIDLLHAIAYKGMNVIATDGADLPTQLWLAGRYVLAAAFLAAPLSLRRPDLDPRKVLAVFGAATALLLASIFWWEVFPVAYRDGQGLTLFKKVSEYAVIGALGLALALLFRRRKDIDETVFRFLALSVAMQISAGLLFTVYVGVNDLANMAGHLFKIGAAVFLYRAVVVTAITNPFALLFREVRQRESLIKRTNEELSAFYRISTTLHRTMDVKELGTQIIDTVTELPLLHIEPRGALFLVEGGALRLLAARGHRESFCRGHETLEYGTCLCGLAAVRGELIVSENSRTDSRHTLSPEEPPHGHIILPLMAPDRRVVGILCLYRRADLAIEEDTKELLSALGGQLGMAIQNARLYEEAKEHALRDPLTGLANRRLMHILMERVMAQSRRFGTPFSIIMLDIDHFKQFNDSLGHSAGDAVLVGLGRLIADAIRQTDLAVRFGGEEFLVLLPEVDAAGACELAERIRNRTEERLGITVSAGVASYREGATQESLIEEADRSLYQAKRSGRNRTHCAGIR